jgi:hypothetical protein
MDATATSLITAILAQLNHRRPLDSIRRPLF